MSDSRFVPLHLPSPFVRLRRPDFRLRTEGARVYVTPLSRDAAAWLERRVPASADAEWSGGSLVLHCDSASAFVDAVRRENLEVTRRARSI
jgi:hypothetical protein